MKFGFFRQKGNARTRRKLKHGFKGVGNHCLILPKEHFGTLKDKPAIVTMNEIDYKLKVRQIKKYIGLGISKHKLSHKGFRNRYVSTFKVQKGAFII